MKRFLGCCSVILLAVVPVNADKLELVAGGEKSEVKSPFGVAFDEAGNLYYVELTANRVSRMDPQGKITVIAGTGKKGNNGDGGSSLEAEFDGPHSLAIGPEGAVYIADTWNSRVRRLDPKTGIVANFAGGEKGFAGDGGPAREAKLGGIYCIAFDPAGKTMYLADLDNRRIRAVDWKTGIVTSVAGNGKKGVPTDGAKATEAPLLDPRAVAVDAKGNIWILERGGHVLRVVDAAGNIRTVAGTGEKGLSDGDGDGLRCKMNGPKHLCIDRDGGVLIADTENHVIRKYFPATGKMIRIAGTGKKGAAGVGGPPDQAELNQPHGITLHSSGDLYISDSSNNRILKIERKR